MRKTIHILTILILAASVPLMAVAGRPLHLQPKSPDDSLVAKAKSDSTLPQKVCSCRLMEVRRGKYDSQLVGIFAEKTFEGKASGNYKILNEYIRREKIYFRIVFLESLELKQSFKTKKDCYSLYKELKSKIARLQMYNIIDVDALTIVAKR
jgi:hypothetical protein